MERWREENARRDTYMLPEDALGADHEVDNKERDSNEQGQEEEGQGSCNLVSQAVGSHGFASRLCKQGEAHQWRVHRRWPGQELT
eukprot:3803107-Rhodomonas_salina.1